MLSTFTLAGSEEKRARRILAGLLLGHGRLPSIFWQIWAGWSSGRFWQPGLEYPSYCLRHEPVDPSELGFLFEDGVYGADTVIVRHRDANGSLAFSSHITNAPPTNLQNAKVMRNW